MSDMYHLEEKINEKNLNIVSWDVHVVVLESERKRKTAVFIGLRAKYHLGQISKTIFHVKKWEHIVSRQKNNAPRSSCVIFKFLKELKVARKTRGK